MASAEKTHCPYCAFQCGIQVTGSPEQPVIAGDPAFPVNRGQLCVKGWNAGATLAHAERLRTPLVRARNGRLEPATWADALELVERELRRVQGAHGRDAVGVFGSGALTNEKAYLLGKFARVALGTRNIDYNGRFCMSSAAAASIRAFGLDRGLPFPLEDVANADVVLLAGANVAETLPPFTQYLHAQRARGGQLIVVDPRRSTTAEISTLHLKITPGSDVALINGLLHILIREELIDRGYIAERTEGFFETFAASAGWWAERVERITGVPEATLFRAARLLGHAPSVVILTGRGPEQQARGVNNTLAYINLALALGMVGKPCSGYGCLTGQGNGQGGREHGQKADQLPGYRKLDDPVARQHVARVWNVDPDALPGPGVSAFEMLSTLGDPGGVKALLVVGSNPVVSSPDAGRIEDRLRRLELLVVCDFFLSETAALAHVVLPTTQWAEEDGTLTNLEGRVIRRRRQFAPPPDVRTDLEILCELARRLGHHERFPTSDPRQVFEELRRASAGGPADYSGITWDKIDASQGVYWPCPDEDHPGTPRLFTDRFPTPSGRARFHPVYYVPPDEEPDASYPLYLTTGRILAHYQSGTQTRRVDALNALAPHAVARIHPSLARRYGLADGNPVTLGTRRGSARFVTELTAAVRPDTIFVPFHWGGEQAVNRLTNPALDPISRMPEFKVCAVRIETPEGGRP
ncbi:MAG: molybdopterin oxidoreductase family protein [Myxococcaceae bacterium]